MVATIHSDIERVFDALGELLIAEGTEFGIVVLGGAALNLLGIVERTTRDVDVLAITSSTLDDGLPLLTPPEPLPEPLKRAIDRVARDFGLPDDWVDTTMGLQLQTGLPPGLQRRIHWRRYGGLVVGLVDRYDLIYFKLYAAADSGGPSSVHYQDLIALRPSSIELQEAATWVRRQDPSPGFSIILEQVMERLRTDVD
jgi:hypothetical protein